MRSKMVGALAQTHSRPASHLRAHDLRKGFGDGAVLDGVSLTVTPGSASP
jgi:ABC-type histidine transport system ATPase subunit